ncbi:hypothetical protein BDW02DRAFT_233626 [Decorospora gaudefroyi]|uniref:GPI anchored serine-threonine rich protein n=1 Tax=Decorospora gaudefroyi TaxID=184978 RepID=A0A6A5KX27_9PLEO|nr:hypothetical protein BDW02DRAFT_233626 [Decorospora gaudefroyi]
MRFFTTVTLAITATASLVAAAEKCAAQNILDTCLAGYQSRIDDCNAKGNDFICLCDVYNDVLVCYNNCPDAPEKPSVQNTVISYCGAAEPLRAAASSSMASVASVAATQSQDASKAPSATATESVTGTAAEDAASPTVSSFEGRANGAFGVSAGAAIVAALGAVRML